MLLSLLSSHISENSILLNFAQLYHLIMLFVSCVDQHINQNTVKLKLKCYLNYSYTALLLSHIFSYFLNLKTKSVFLEMGLVPPLTSFSISK